MADSAEGKGWAERECVGWVGARRVDRRLDDGVV